MLISLESVPMVPLGMQNRLTFFTWPVSHSRTCSSENSCAPPPEPSTTPISRCCSSDSCETSKPASRSASVDAASASGTTRETCLRSLRFHPCQFVEVLDLAGNLHGQFTGIEAANPLHPADAIKHGAAERLVSNAVRADRAHSRDHDAFFHRRHLAVSNQQLAELNCSKP